MGCIVTTSWDDGDALDERVAQLLQGHGIRGTFYIAHSYRASRVQDEVIKNIAEYHEIGGHTLTHPNLTLISADRKRAEISGGKKWLEDVIGKEIDMFCYPGGVYDEHTIELVKEAGFLGARATKQPIVGTPFHPYRFGVSLTLFPYPFTLADKLCTGYRRTVAHAPVALPRLLSGERWQRQARLERRALDLFEQARQQNGVFHLYGHSWANTRYGLWPVLERILEQISGRDDCEYLTNGEVVRRLLAASGEKLLA